MNHAPAMSTAALSVWAKSNHETGGWMPLWRHLDDSAEVAGRLWDEWIPEQVRRVVSAGMRNRQDDGRTLLCWLAGVHDIGKVSPVFAVQVPALADRMRQQGLAMPASFADRNILRHELAGHLILSRWLRERFGWARERSAPYAVVVGGHHGVPPDTDQLVTARRHPEMLGIGLWAEVQDEYLDRAAELLNVADRLPVWSGEHVAPTAQALLTAAVIISDWIASAEEYFPYNDCCSDQERLIRAVRQLDLPAPWSATDDDVLTGFAERFGLPEHATARPLQVAAVEIARSTPEPGLLIIEAPMGEGKTEAALLAAETYAARTGAGGCFIALPTQATSNAMFSRVLIWLDYIGERHPDGVKSVALAHGKAVLNDDYQGLVRAGRARSVGVDSDEQGHPDAELVAHQWLSGRKKSALASFVVGTIDQLLFGALKSRHLVLRHLALASKVVVIDEAHAYDVYMSDYLDRVLEWLGAYRVPVIVLSATLPAQRRREMVGAYDRGRNFARKAPKRSVRGELPSLPHPELDGDIGYPVAVASTGTDRAVVRAIEAAPRSTAIEMVPIADDLDVLTAQLSTSLAEGGCAVVIRNTVARVQETAAHLRSRLADTQLIVTHARFVATDRAANDTRLLEMFGPRGSMRRRVDRCVVVASQVVEQSLDVDFDLLVTDLAPVDLVLQRLGRLHRHQRGMRQSERSERLRAPRCLVTGVEDWASAPPTPVRGSRIVYDTYHLYRSLAVLGPFLSTDVPLRLPSDIAPLVQSAYGDGEVGPSEWQDSITIAHEKHLIDSAERRRNARVFQLREPGQSLIGWLAAGVGDVVDEDSPTGVAAVRDGRPGIEVLVVRRDERGTLTTLPWLPKNGGRAIPVHDAVPGYLARTIAACTLPLPTVLCYPGTADVLIADLERNYFPGWQESFLLKGTLVLVLDSHSQATVAGYQLRYTPALGLEHYRDNG